jgi:hypothetical protein
MSMSDGRGGGSTGTSGQSGAAGQCLLGGKPSGQTDSWTMQLGGDWIGAGS